MTETGEPEPSMDEILASIRKIISEGGGAGEESHESAEDEALLLTNRHVIEGTVTAIERGATVDAVESGVAKHVVSENAIRAVRRGLAAIGNPGLSRSNPIERHYRDVLCARVHTPQGDAALALAGRRSLSDAEAARR